MSGGTSIPPSENGQVVLELRRDLTRKYKIHKAKIETYWRSFNQAQRRKCIKAGAADGVVLQHPNDPSLGNVCKMTPEWNLRELTEPGSDFLLDLLEFRATKDLYGQYNEPFKGRPCDHDFIQEMMATRNLRHHKDFRGGFTLFLDEKDYGKHIRFTAGHSIRDDPQMQMLLRTRGLVPQEMGELILTRQIYLLQSLIIVIDDILEQGSQTRATKAPKSQDDTPHSALSTITPPSASKKLNLDDMISVSHNQRDSADLYLNSLSTEPVVLAHAVNFAFFSRPELVPDEKGRSLPVHTDKYISGAFFDAMHTAVQTAAIWNYLGRLLEYLGTLPRDKAARAPVLQEIANVCNLEYNRAQAHFKRHIQTASGLKFFKRLSNSYDKAGNARVGLKGDPTKLAKGDRQMQFMLRLCQTETTVSKAVEWVNKLASLHENNPTVREELEEREYDALVDLYDIVSFIQDVTPVISMPSLSRKSGQQFITKTQELEAELSQLKQGIDLLDFALPIDNLLEPGMADGALKKLDYYIVEKTGTKLGFLYEDTIEHCLASVQRECQKELDKSKPPAQGGEAGYIPFPETDDRPEVRVQQRRQKEKTRPTQASFFEIAPTKTKLVTDELAALSLQTFKVSAATAGVFSTLFDKSQARGSVPWTSFESALAELKFSVIPKFGSVYTFYPPETLAVNKSFTVHRPHKSRIEGYLLPIFAKRLNRLYGWGEKTFVVA
ncbi:ipa protein [Rhypophila decipiens]|uniref:Ipa protein n=1 Tax=Rhypophila decipiens TaxID=261697 RepID=A0AAN6Y6C3_9PEZI|nr:ipa protein [Rhypophila decipiens]